MRTLKPVNLAISVAPSSRSSASVSFHLTLHGANGISSLARCAGRTGSRDHQHQGELDFRRGCPKLFRRRSVSEGASQDRILGKLSPFARMGQRRKNSFVVQATSKESHSRYSPPYRSATKSDLCHEAPALPVTRPSRSSATRLIDKFLGGFFLHK